MTILDECPSPPDWALPWQRLRDRYEWVEALHGCPQDRAFHAEGDVGIHTRMACEALAGSAGFRALPEAERRIVFAAVLLHDVAKPACTKHEGGRISSRGHSSRGDILARRMLWRQGIEFAQREAICALIRHHQVPFFLIDRDDSRKLAYRVSQSTRCDHLALVAWADGVGRRCADPADQQRILDNVALFREYCREHECLIEPRRFPSDHSRFLYFHKPDRDPNYHAHDDTTCEVTLMAGLPGAGKDHWIRHNARDCEVVSLDAIRVELGVDPAAPQGRVVDAGRRRARQLLQRRRALVWNATNLSRQLREQLVALFAGYGARIRIVYVEDGEDTIRARNRARKDPVPERVIDKLLTRWTVPTRADAHELLLSVPGAGAA
ncbi:AAA family ATPase [Haliangium sp.]|uniref:AAA family ATPase n=1 Tax=Haliangium sp. TaxID=2663208 RepID=UPI003D0CAA44